MTIVSLILLDTDVDCDVNTGAATDIDSEIDKTSMTILTSILMLISISISIPKANIQSSSPYVVVIGLQLKFPPDKVFKTTV